MKFIRRHDLDPHTRIKIVKLAWQDQGIYGKMTQIAQAYHISRTFLYQLTWAAQHQLELLFSESKLLDPDLPSQLEPLILLCRLEGRCSIPSLSAILKRLEYRPNSVGYLSECLQAYGRSVPSTLSMPETKVVFYLSDEIFAIRHPILVTIEAQSTAILKIELAGDRSAETWKAHFDDLGAHRFQSLGMASDRGVGLTAGYRAACQEISSMSFKTSLTDATTSNAKPIAPLVRKSKRRRNLRTPKAKRICKSAWSNMREPTKRVSQLSRGTINSICCSICSVTPYTCARTRVDFGRLKRSVPI